MRPPLGSTRVRVGARGRFLRFPGRRSGDGLGPESRLRLCRTPAGRRRRCGDRSDGAGLHRRPQLDHRPHSSFRAAGKRKLHRLSGRPGLRYLVSRAGDGRDRRADGEHVELASTGRRRGRRAAVASCTLVPGPQPPCSPVPGRESQCVPQTLRARVNAARVAGLLRSRHLRGRLQPVRKPDARADHDHDGRNVHHLQSRDAGCAIDAPDVRGAQPHRPAMGDCRVCRLGAGPRVHVVGARRRIGSD